MRIVRPTPVVQVVGVAKEADGHRVAEIGDAARVIVVRVTEGEIAAIDVPAATGDRKARPRSISTS